MLPIKQVLLIWTDSEKSQILHKIWLRYLVKILNAIYII